MGRVTYIAVLASLLLGGPAALAEPYWIEWEGDDWPENENPGWVRNWGNWQGQFQGGAYRTLENGILTYDSLYDPGVFDSYEMHRQGAFDPGPGELFVAQWKLWTEQAVGWYDPGLGFQSDEARGVGLAFDGTSVFSVYEQRLLAYLEPGQFHEFALWSVDMNNYVLDVDGDQVASGVFRQGVSTSWLFWGDCVQGAASLHHWDYVRFGALVVPRSGDVNCDGTFDFGDVNPFVHVLSDPSGYAGTYPLCWPTNADMNEDGTVDFGDINPFVAGLLGR